MNCDLRWDALDERRVDGRHARVPAAQHMHGAVVLRKVAGQAQYALNGNTPSRRKQVTDQKKIIGHVSLRLPSQEPVGREVALPYQQLP